MRDLN